MKNFHNPWWLIPVNIIPVFILFRIFYGSFELIESLLTAQQKSHWIYFGISLAFLWMFHMVYAGTMIVRRHALNSLYAVMTVLVYTVFLYLYFTFYNTLIPFNIPRWMISENMMTYAGSFILPTILHSIFILAYNTIKKDQSEKPWRSFLFAVIIPVAWYILFQTILPLWRTNHAYETHLLVIFLMTATVAFLFFLIRGLYLLVTRKENFLKKYSLVWKIIVALLFPLGGLLVNNDVLFDCFFGNFSHPWFYALALLNGIVVCLPDRDNKYYRLVLFTLRSVTFTYIIYFFLVFLPYLPLSVLAIIAFGLGFLMLTPLILMVVQTHILVKDFIFLNQYYSKRAVHSLFIASVTMIPVIMTASYAQEKDVLKKALAYVYEPDYGQFNPPSINRKSLTRVLQHVESIKNEWGSSKIPFISAYYNWIVLDNLTLSDQKLELLKRIFTGKHQHNSSASFQLTGTPPTTENIRITDTNIHSVYDCDQQSWVSEVNLFITNSHQEMTEYETFLELPEGAWINDYYLCIEDEKVPGILAEKKSATWIYQQITRLRQDPGILHYTTGNTIAFRVFPFAPFETRQTGFRILHKEPFELKIDDQNFRLGEDTNAITEVKYSPDRHTVYIPASLKKQLVAAQRTPVYHFIMDCSTGKETQAEKYPERIEDFIRRKRIDRTAVRFTLTNTYATTHQYSSHSLVSALKASSFSGGFFLERAIQEILFQQFTHPTFTYPVMIVITDNPKDIIISKDFKDWKVAFPENDLFYMMDAGGNLTPYSLLHRALSPQYDNQENFSVSAWPDLKNPLVFVRLDDRPTVVTIPSSGQMENLELKENDWVSALALQGLWQHQTFYPHRLEEKWLNMVKGSFTTNIMTPPTAFISLENEAQRKTLLKKQQEVLNANSNLSVGEEDRMSEPGIIILVITFGIAFYFKRQSDVAKKTPATFSAYCNTE